MSVRMRHTKGHTGNRRSHHALESTTLVKDTASGALRLPHRLDETTGMYRGKQIAAPKVKKAAPLAGSKKGPDTEAIAEKHAHEHMHEHAHEAHQNAEVKGSKGVEKKATGGRPKARSGFGGGA